MSHIVRCINKKIHINSLKVPVQCKNRDFYLHLLYGNGLAGSFGWLPINFCIQIIVYHLPNLFPQFLNVAISSKPSFL